jgi:hypothetical protein
MRRLIGKVGRKFKNGARLVRERLVPLYSPDPNNLDLSQHMSAALDWLKRAQDARNNGGVSYGVQFGSGFMESYPETTGYICRTFVELAQSTGTEELLERAIQMGVWESDIQMAEGAVMGGPFSPNPTPAVFNTGMVMLGWNALIRATGDDRFKASCRRAADWLLRVQEPDGNWIRGNSRFAVPGATVYNVKAAWGLCEAGSLLGQQGYVDAALRNAEFSLSRQEPNGWFRDCCLSDPVHPLLHTIAYAMQGLLEIGKLTHRDDLIAAARKTADAQIEIMGEDGFLPGRQDSHFKGSVNWCCLTGSAQTSVVWSELFLLTSDRKYLEAVLRVNRYIMARHDIRNADSRLRGGVPGSWPTWAPYGRLTVLNWATKYLVDALSRQQKIEARAAA